MCDQVGSGPEAYFGGGWLVSTAAFCAVSRTRTFTATRTLRAWFVVEGKGL
jgi:hypothetical protein